MRRMQIAGALLATALVSAVTAAGAVAAPPEFSPPFPNPFTSASKAVTLQSVGKVKLKCTESTNAGEVTGPKTLTVRIDFKNCTISTVAGVLCQSPNGKPGEIQTELLIGQLGYVTREPVLTDGVDLSNPTGGPMAVFFCGAAVSGEILGSVIGQVSPVNKVIKPPAKLKLVFGQVAGHQHWRMLLGGPVDVPLLKLGAAPAEEAGLQTTDLLGFAAPIVVSA